MRNPLTRTKGTETDSRAPGTATPTDLPRERVDEMQMRTRQREEFGGFSLGSVFFGWLVAIGLTTLLVGALGGIAAGTGITDLSGSDVSENADEVGLAGGIVLLAVLLVSHYAGGYVAGRLARFDGARQGVGVWVLGAAVMIGLGIGAAVVDDDTLTATGAIALGAAVIGTLIAAIAGGKVGERFHRKVDRVAFEDAAPR
jgi:hypothetical protein